MRLFRLDIQIVNNKIPKFETISLGKSLENVFVILQPIPLPANSSFTSIDTGTPQARTKVRLFLAGPINCGITIQAPIASLSTPIYISNAGTTQLTTNWQTTNATQLTNNWRIPNAGATIKCTTDVGTTDKHRTDKNRTDVGGVSLCRDPSGIVREVRNPTIGVGGDIGKAEEEDWVARSHPP